ncbi:MAG: squalene synthase HpnC [Comamonadaceae bacterium]|nr:squalene synthase HpnC [Comamonadaceae bacterium]
MNQPSPAPVTSHATAAAVTHYENFPVASLLCPPHLRPAIAAIYHFARTADDLADEGSASTSTRLSDLCAYRADLLAVADSLANVLPAQISQRWPQVFGPLHSVMQAHQLPVNLLTDLLDAFEQDVRFTAEQRRYATDAELLDYCTRSANPVGRLLLHLYGVTDAASLQQSDAICTALQLINFWQDVSVDVARQRWYPSTDSMARFEVVDADLAPDSRSPKAAQLIAYYAGAARARMLKGAQLAVHLPGRAGWELRLVVQGGLRILDKIEALGFRTWQQRPRLTLWDLPLLLWRAWCMPAAKPSD